MKLLSNDCGGLFKAKKVFEEDLKTDSDFLEYKKQCKKGNAESFGVINPNLDIFCNNKKQIPKIVRKYLKLK